MYGCESWTIKKAEHQRIDVFELWCWRRLLRVPWTTRRSNQSILKEISPEYSLEGLILKLKLQYFGHLMQRDDSLGKTLKQEEKGMTEDEMAGWYHRLNGHEFEQTPGDGEGHGSLVCWSPWGHKELDMTEWLNNNQKCLHWSVLNRILRGLSADSQSSLCADFFSLVLMPVNLIYIILLRLLALSPQLRSLLDSTWIPRSYTMN